MAKKDKGLGLTTAELSLAKELFTIKHPYITFKAEDCIRELIYQEAARLGLNFTLEQKQAYHPMICHEILKLSGLLSGFVSKENQSLFHNQQIDAQIAKIADMDVNDLANQVI